MKDIIAEIVKSNLGPLIFLVLAGLLCIMLPAENATEAIYLVIGAALTRVKRVQ